MRMLQLSCLCLLLGLPAATVTARLEAAVVLPHGDFAWDPWLLSGPAERDAAQAIAQAARQAGSWLSSHIQPEVILVVSPHGVAVQDNFGIVVGATTASGSATMGQDLRPTDHSTVDPYTIELHNVAINASLSQDLLEHLTQSSTVSPSCPPSNTNNNVTGLYLSPDGSTPSPLFWGEVVPLLLIPNKSAHERDIRNLRHASHDMPDTTTATTRQQQSSPQNPRSHILWSLPRRRLTAKDAGVSMVPELLQMGTHIRHWMDHEHPQIRFAVVISGDLAHTHRASGPYGYAPESVKLDQALGNWAGQAPCQPNSTHALLQQATQWQPQGLSCGFTGMVLWQGIMCGDGGSTTNQQDDTTATTSRQQPSNITPPQNWKSRVLVNRNVTYYGMMVAQFWRDDDDHKMNDNDESARKF
mmetsp:Transcript_13506/g.27955  ORF Transcript_13506/g.27955 Transcript_13506/m.27955 type:complete len:414 (-) Transcript_13506:528-1769(-)